MNEQVFHWARVWCATHNTIALCVKDLNIYRAYELLTSGKTGTTTGLTIDYAKEGDRSVAFIEGTYCGIGHTYDKDRKKIIYDCDNVFLIVYKGDTFIEIYDKDMFEVDGKSLIKYMLFTA